MKKKILSIALVALSFVAFNTAAQATEEAAVCVSEQVSGPGKQCSKNCRQMAFFEGINLTDAQKAQLKQLQAKQKAQRAECDKQRKAEKHHADSTRFEARRAARKAYLEEVKGIIGPDNYVIFLENNFVNSGAPKGDKATFGKSHKHGKSSCDKKYGDRKDRHGDITLKRDKKQDKRERR